MTTLVKIPHCWKSHVETHMLWVLKRDGSFEHPKHMLKLIGPNKKICVVQVTS